MFGTWCFGNFSANVLCAQFCVLSSLVVFPALIDISKMHFRRFKMYNAWILCLKIYAAMECQELNNWEPKAHGS